MFGYSIVRKLDKLGRISLPKELRATHEIAINDPLEIFTEGNSIILKKYQPGCIICGGMLDGVRFKGKLICFECINQFKGTVPKI